MLVLGKMKKDFARSESERLFTGNSMDENDTSDLRRSSIPPPPSPRKKRTRRNRKKERLNTQLLDAAQINEIEKCRRLIEEGADIDAGCRDTGATALMVSAAWGNADLICFLLEKGASPLIRDNEGRTPAHVAAARGEGEALRALLESKDVGNLINAQVEIEERREDDCRYFDSWIHQHDTLLPNMPKLLTGSTPLHAASQRSNSYCVKLLLDKGADTEVRDSRGLTALDVAGEIVHRPDDCEPIQDDPSEGYHAGSDLPARPKASSFMAVMHPENLIANEPAVFDEKKSTTRHVIEEIEAIRRIKRHSDALNLPLEEPSKDDFNQSEQDDDWERVSLQSFEDDDRSFENNFQLKSVIPNPNVRLLRARMLERLKRTKRKKIKMIKNCLHTAVKEGDEQLIKYLMKVKFDYIFQTDENGRTPAHIAVEIMDLRILSLLLNIKEAVNAQDSKGRSLLYRSAELDWINGVDFLLNANADITKQANDDSTVLHVAARKSDSALLEELFTFDDAKKVVNEFDKNHQTPLCCAVEVSSVPCVEYLLNHDACSTVVQPGGLTLLHIAAQNGSKEILQLLLNRGANILIDNFNTNSKGGMTPLHVSCKEGHADCVELFIQSHANIYNKTSTKGKPYYSATPLHLAARYGRLNVAELLIKFDKDVVHQRNADSWQPLHVAARFGKTECVRLLLKSGGNLASEVTLVGHCKTALDMIINFIPQPIEFLQEIFDSFISTNGHVLTHADCIVTFKYDLFSPSGEENRKQLLVLDAVINSPKIILQEILLLHPLAETFLFLKWKKLRIFFFLLFAIYCVLTLSITAMNLTICTDLLPHIPNSLHIYRVTTIISLIVLAILEIFQASRLQRYYWTELESWVKWITFVLAGWLSLPDFRFKQGAPICFTNVSSVAVLLSWVELLLLLSRLPNWGFCVLMFCRVAQNVLKVLATFAILFFGFMFSMIIEFRSNSPFSNIWLSFTKVIVMTSEIEYTDMFQKPVDEGLLWSFVARIILLSFVILITIVLMNLMVGIAVNDITLLEAQGRTRRLAKQVSFLSLIEMFVYNGYLLKVLPKCLKKALKNRRKVPLDLHLRTGKPHKLDMKIFPVSLRHSIIDKVSNIKKSDDKNNDLKDLNDKIDKLIKQQGNQIGESMSSLSSDDTAKHRNVTLSMLKQVASTLQEVKLELNKLKTNFEPRRSLRTPKPKDAVLMKA